MTSRPCQGSGVGEPAVVAGIMAVFSLAERYNEFFPPALCYTTSYTKAGDRPKNSCNFNPQCQ